MACGSCSTGTWSALWGCTTPTTILSRLCDSSLVTEGCGGLGRGVGRRSIKRETKGATLGGGGIRVKMYFLSCEGEDILQLESGGKDKI